MLRDFVLDRYEPNDSLDRAWGPLVSGGLYEAYFASASDKDDFYYFDMPAKHVIEAWLRDIPAGADYDLYLYDDLPALLAYSASQGTNDESLVTAALPPGRYYLRVRRVSAENAVSPYTFGAAYR
jgi:hypothetical protein